MQFSSACTGQAGLSNLHACCAAPPTPQDPQPPPDPQPPKTLDPAPHPRFAAVRAHKRLQLRVQLDAVLGQVVVQLRRAQHPRNLDQLVVVVVAAEEGLPPVPLGCSGERILLIHALGLFRVSNQGSEADMLRNQESGARVCQERMAASLAKNH